MINTAKRLGSVQEYYFSKKLREVQKLISEGKSIINLGVGSPDLLPHHNVIHALINALSDAKSNEYQSYQGIPELRQEIGNFYKKHYRVNLNFKTEILPLLGSKEGITHISMAFLNKGDKVLIPNPGYPTYASVTKLAEAEPVFYDLTEETKWQPDFDALGKQDLSGVKLMWVSYPHMPTGAKAEKGTFEKLIDFAKKHDILLVNDNPYSFILNDNPNSILEIEGAKDVAIELNSLSKTFNISGWRVGMVLGKPEFIEAILKVKSNMDSGMFYPIQKGAIQALKSDDSWFASLNETYLKRKKMILELASKLGCSYDENCSGLFVWAKLPDSVKSSEDFVDYLLYEKSIFVPPGKIFGSNGERYIRFSLCVTETKIKEAIERL